MTGPGGPPLLSVVLPVGGVEEYLPACLDSVLGQPGPAIEVIAVDDASPDRCGAILDARAARDPRLRVIHLPTAIGPGPARDRGLADAAGEYVWFVDPDDLLAPGALAAVAARLERDEPDLLLLDYLLLHRSGRTEHSPGADLLAAAAGTGGAATLAGRPGLINRTMTLWSKVFRRPFLTGLGIALAPGVHEDVPLSCAALLSARRISLLDEVCYLYRQRGRSFLATPSMGHFSIFSSYARVFAFLAEDPWPAARPPLTPAVRAAVFGRAMEHYTTVLAAGLVPRTARRDYFHRMAADFRRYRPPGYQRPAGARGLKMRLVERDGYLAYSLLGPLNELRVGARSALRRVAQQPG
ncbi:MAG: glycosyltransferase family 2 protein [Gemmatimonadota bacterium]